jgi:integrase
MSSRVLSEFGEEKLADLERSDVQRFVHELLADGCGGSTVRTTIAPLRSLCRQAIDDGDLMANPCSGVKLPSPNNRAPRIADPAEAAALLAALPAGDRALWATALYAGLRRGELQALRDRDVDLAAGVLHVHRGWDRVEGEQATKGRNRRRVPIVPVLRDYLLEHRLDRGGRPDDLVFGRSSGSPFAATTVVARAERAWTGAGLEPIGLHECRHGFVSLMAAAGIDPVAISRFAGHASVGFTLDRYGHLFEGSEAHAAELFERYLRAGEARDEDQVRASGELTGASTGASRDPVA